MYKKQILPVLKNTRQQKGLKCSNRCSVDHEGIHYSICGSTCVNVRRTDFKHPLKITGFKHTEQNEEEK